MAEYFSDSEVVDDDFVYDGCPYRFEQEYTDEEVVERRIRRQREEQLAKEQVVVVVVRRKMETEPKAEAEPDNSEVERSDTTEFEVTAGRLEQLMKSMDVLLSDVEQLRSHCSHQATELMKAAVELRQQQDELKESYSNLSREMQEIIDSVDDLFNTKSAFETKEKQAQKLNRQL